MTELLILQEKDQRLAALKKELANIPAERAMHERQLAACAARCEAAKSRLREIEAAKKNLEVEAAAKRDQIEKYKVQQMQTRKNEEFAALKNQIASTEKTISEIEDRELELMEEVEKLTPQIREADTIYREEKEKIDKAFAALTAKKPVLEERVAVLQTERDAHAATVDEDQRDIYERIFRSKDGLAIVPIDAGACGGCQMTLTSQTVNSVKGGKGMIHCETCGRILHA